MGEETKELRRLVIKAYHVREVQWGSENEVTENGILTVDEESSGRYKRGKEEYISDISFRIIRPEERDQYTNTIMDIIPISAKVLGDIGDGITHTPVSYTHLDVYKRQELSTKSSMTAWYKKREPGFSL